MEISSNLDNPSLNMPHLTTSKTRTHRKRSALCPQPWVISSKVAQLMTEETPSLPSSTPDGLLLVAVVLVVVLAAFSALPQP